MAYSRISMQALHGQKIGVNCITGQKSGADCILASHLRGFWPKSIPQLQKRRANRISVLYHKPVTWPFDNPSFPQLKTVVNFPVLTASSQCFFVQKVPEQR